MLYLHWTDYNSSKSPYNSRFSNILLSVRDFPVCLYHVYYDAHIKTFEFASTAEGQLFLWINICTFESFFGFFIVISMGFEMDAPHVTSFLYKNKPVSKWTLHGILHETETYSQRSAAYNNPVLARWNTIILTLMTHCCSIALLDKTRKEMKGHTESAKGAIQSVLCCDRNPVYLQNTLESCESVGQIKGFLLKTKNRILWGKSSHYWEHNAS